jgi:hypothetical protein
MFARIKICFVVWRDRTPNASAHRGEHQNGSIQSQFDAGVPCGNCRRSLANSQLHRKRQISLVSHHLCENKPGVGRQPELAFGRLAAAQCRAHRANQEGVGAQASGEIMNPGLFPSHRSYFDKFFRRDFVTKKLFAKAEKRNTTHSH